MRTRFSSHPSLRTARPVSAPEFAFGARALNRTNWSAARRLTLALAASAPLCAGALLAGPAQAAPTVESDENGPLVQIIKPGYNDVLKGKYRILIQVTARKYNPQSVEMFIDDQSATPGPLEISSFASSSYDFDTRLMSEGRHKLTVRVTDSQGFRGWSEVTVFVNNKGVVDTQAPDLRFVGIEPFQELSGSIKLEVNAADNFGVKMLQISINPADSPNKPAYSWFMNQPPYKVNLDTIGKDIPDGLYVLKALAFDSLDQQGEASPLTFGIVNNQINATRVQDMLDGQRQMQKVLAGEKLTEAAPDKASERNSAAKAAAQEALDKADKVLSQNAPEAPADVLPAATPDKAPEVTEKVAPESTEQTPAVENAEQARNFNSATQIPSMPQSAPAAVTQTAPRVMPPNLNIAPQISNPGIQLPLVQLPDAPAPQAVAPQGVAPQTQERVAETTPETVAPNEEIAPTETVTPTETVAPNEATSETVAPTDEVAPVEAATATEATAPTVEVAPQPGEEVRIAMNQSLPVSQRNGGQASLSRAAAIELAVAAPGGALIESARSSAPIAVTRFGQPNLAGRNITDMAVLSQSSTSDESRLSNAELSRLRSSKTRVLSAARPLLAAHISQPTDARALQIGAPALSQRPILSRAITPDSLSTPAPKLTREARATPLAPSKTAKSAGSLSKTVLSGQRLAPIAPETATKSAKPTSVPGAISKAVASSQRARPIEIAPVRVAKNSAVTSAPQMSAPSAPRMSESASGQGVPQRNAGKAQATSNDTPKTLDGRRVAALPRPGAVTSNRSGASIVATPISGPFEFVESNTLPVPTSYRAQRNTTLRAVAARFGLPVELVAISNGLTTDAKINSGTEVKLPRPLEVSYNGAPVAGDAPSMLMGDTAVTAFRFMFEKTGGKIEWDAANQRVVARKDGREITLTIGSNVAKVGDREVAMELAAFLFQGRTMVPLRLFEEGLNAQVEWNPQTGRLVVAMAG